jgi:hypothetical protein
MKDTIFREDVLQKFYIACVQGVEKADSQSLMVSGGHLTLRQIITVGD